MIRACILDIDGVLVGDEIGYNTPFPHHDVTERLMAIRQSGIPVILCTAKPHYSIQPIITNAKLTNPHITFAGGIIIDPIGDSIVESHPFPQEIGMSIVRTCVERAFYTELYTKNSYYILRSDENDLTRVHTHILQQPPILVDSLEAVCQKEPIYKILPVVADESGIPDVENTIKPYAHEIEITWSIHPIANPHQFCNIAPLGISKRKAALTVLSHLGIDPTETLGIGDSTSDWKFMELCGFAATLENGQEPLKALVNAKGDAGFTGGHVDANGILSIFDHFRLP